MSEKCEEKEEDERERAVVPVSAEILGPIGGRASMLETVIGAANADRWNELRGCLGCTTDEEFAKLLLDLAQKHLDRGKLKSSNKHKSHNGRDTKKNVSTQEMHSSKKKDHKHKRKKCLKQQLPDTDRDKIKCIEPPIIEIAPQETIPVENKIIEVKPDVIKPEIKEKEVETDGANSVTVNIKNELPVPLDKLKIPNVIGSDSELIITAIVKKEKEKQKKKSPVKKIDDVRKAPELFIQKEVPVKTEMEKENRLAIKIKLCNVCETRHLQDQCPLQKPHFECTDNLTPDKWLIEYKEKFEIAKTEDPNEETASINQYSFSYVSLPNSLYLDETNTAHGLGVFAKEDLVEFTQFGPLIGKIVKEVDIPEDCTMRDIYEINNDTSQIYFNTENLDTANWMRFIRPAPMRDQRNMFVISKDNQLYFTTIKNIVAGDELLYWQDCVVLLNKKRMEKTSCGGCNMTFLHPLYYRVHCSVFHDVRYSLTIRKYHCKVCGAAVLGKENIMKHATELHNGQGAYQCQFCKKFFLRLNYLEMHRTYGCSANPHRSRPLCDFCGRKFCQPQKLKVHIKRMHSDMSEVIKEFQCKNCFKLLGSRAALQRHLKEVHQKQVEGACSCSKCGKLFQNKSNLKIHMLTHSGVKPFKCAEQNCVAAFTTKQCLQFHYKKVHNYTEDMMPKIERSVDYTFEAYSGNDDQESMEFSGQENSGNSDVQNVNTNSDQEDNNLDEKSDPPDLHSPCQPNEQSNSDSPPTLEAYAPNMKILSKGSKKWIGEQPFYGIETNKTPVANVEEDDFNAEHRKLHMNTSFVRHESSNASLLVEAALDSVCSEPNIDIDVSTTPSCTDALVNNLYTLSQTDTLADVTYSHSVDVNDSRDINLISPSVNDHISVTDDINDELHQTQNMGIDYSSFHQEDFSPATSPSRNNFVRDYINANSPQNAHNYEIHKGVSPNRSPRYDFGQGNQESDDSNGIGAQNLSLHNSKDGIQLDLSIYKSRYNFDSNFLRKDLRSKMNFEEQERKQVYILDVEKCYEDTNKFNVSNQDNLEIELTEKDFENIPDTKYKDDLDLSSRTLDVNVRNKFELDLDLRKSYDDSELRRNTYETSLDDFRMKSYDLDNIEIRNSLDRSLIDDFRTDRNFEPLILNPSELQGLDMSARSYHNYPNLNRYHHLYSEVERPTVDLRLNYSPPPPTYSHADILRAVSLDLTPPGRHSVDLSLRTHQIANSRLLTEHTMQTQHRLSLDQTRLLTSDLTPARHLTDTRILTDINNRILSDHTTNRILSNDQLSTNRLLGTDQRLLPEDTRLITEQPRLLDQGRLLTDGRMLPGSANGNISPVPYPGYSVSPGPPYHPTALAPRPHAASPNSAPYHHYTAYY